ncbi:MAG: hypothetical protein AAF585_11330 [Verrucomicrobiota bacterium]
MRLVQFVYAFFGWIAVSAAAEIQVTAFVADVTPPIGSPLCYSAIKPAAKIEESLTARGVVLSGSGKPIVLCVADFVGISNGSNDVWRQALAEAAGTTAERVAMHVVHNHDSPGYDMSAAELLTEQGLPDLTALKKAHDEAPSSLSRTPVTLVPITAQHQVPVMGARMQVMTSVTILSDLMQF